MPSKEPHRLTRPEVAVFIQEHSLAGHPVFAAHTSEQSESIIIESDDSATYIHRQLEPRQALYDVLRGLRLSRIQRGKIWLPTYIPDPSPYIVRYGDQLWLGNSEYDNRRPIITAPLTGVYLNLGSESQTTLSSDDETAWQGIVAAYGKRPYFNL